MDFLESINFDFYRAVASLAVVIVFLQALYLQFKYSKLKTIVERKPESITVVAINLLVYGFDLIYLIINGKFIATNPLNVSLAFLFLIVGLSFIFIGRRELGINWSLYIEIHDKHKYVKSGIYRYFDHPIYYGEILAVTAGAIFINSIYHWIMFIPFLLVMFKKMKSEDLLLQKHFSPQKEYV